MDATGAEGALLKVACPSITLIVLACSSSLPSPARLLGRFLTVFVGGSFHERWCAIANWFGQAKNCCCGLGNMFDTKCLDGWRNEERKMDHEESRF